MTRHLHIVSFDIPYPANYGGAMDVFYKIRALHEAGIHIILHCHYKGELRHEQALEQLCEQVYYYPRRTTIWQNFYALPYAVKSRSTEPLLTNLLKDDYPILFEGLVCCQLLMHHALQARKCFFRECNIEHDYYRALGKATSSVWKKIYFYFEAQKLQAFERKCLPFAKGIFAVAHQDEQHFANMFPTIPVVYIPSFHAEDRAEYETDHGEYILYHGNLGVAENNKAATHIITRIAPQLPDIPFVIAGLHPSKDLKALAAKQPNIFLVDSPSEEGMKQLIMDAQIHLLMTFQGTGLKLKLLHVLYLGRHVIVNPDMVVGTELGQLCQIGQADADIVRLCRDYFRLPYTQSDATERESLLHNLFSNYQLANTLIRHIFSHDV